MSTVRKLLCLSPYLYDNTLPEFQRNNSGFGMMVHAICTCLSKECDVAWMGNTITPGHPKGEGRSYTILPHRWRDVIRCIGPRDIRTAIRVFFRYPQKLKGRARYAYFGLNQGIVRAAIRKYKPDVVHIHGISVATQLFIRTCMEEHVPIAVTMHGVIGLDEIAGAPPWEMRMEKPLLQWAEKECIPVSIVGTGGKRAVCEAYGLSGENIVPIPNCADLEKNTVPRDVRKTWNIPETHKIVVVIGSISDRKNQLQVAQAYACLPEAVRDTTTILFLGQQADGGALEQEIQKQGSQPQLVMCGFVPRGELESYYQAASLNVMASISEGFGLPVAEGFQYGVPAVLFSDVDAAEDFRSEEAAILVEERTTEALAAAMTQALERNWDHAAIIEHGKKFSPEQMTKQYLSLLSSTLK